MPDAGGDTKQLSFADGRPSQERKDVSSSGRPSFEAGASPGVLPRELSVGSDNVKRTGSLMHKISHGKFVYERIMSTVMFKL